MLPNEITRLESSGGSYLDDLLYRNFCDEQEEETVTTGDVRKRKDFDAPIEEQKGKKQKTDEDFETIQKRESDLVQAARAGSLEVVKMLISNGTNVNAQVCGCTSLMYAAFYGRELMITFLIDNGADLNVQNLSGETALMWAVECKTGRLSKFCCKEDVRPTRQIFKEKPLSTKHLSWAF